ncbi:hypothetical protein [Flagellimonas myxillae]|uniref:hypothetical protein n=1 Tax=Flagellimonas myxillae TaxID=2942214 RepID=UPI00201EBA4F|nr:hypothetical protein [Muricauda myxillae]MCL6265916.1 hypothetical protein [Muricauda myxillae]
MKTTKNFIGTYASPILMFFLGAMLSMQSCKTDKKQVSESEEANSKVIEIVSEKMDFQMVDTIPSGWNTFRYINKSPQTHFFLVDKYPPGKTSEDAEKVIGPIFDAGMKLINEGKMDEAMEAFGQLPEWFGEVVFLGGTGLLSPGVSGETTLYLEPGNYILECYVKMSNGIFHTSMGMTKDLVVSEQKSGNQELKANINLSVSSSNGIFTKDSIVGGLQTFAVHFVDQIVHENFVGHDINLVKLSEDASMEELENWMNWATPTGLMEPAPEGLTFLGGVNDMPAGRTGFFTVQLDPGKYVLISEVPNPTAKGLLRTFEIKE